METRMLGSTDLQVSSIGLGCVTFGREIDKDTSFKVMDHALQRGITLFDTAEAYAQGASEAVLGEWIANRGVRNRIVLTTKVAPPLPAKRVIESAEASLKRLHTDRIDLFQLHGWDNDVPLEETLDALGTLVRDGKVRCCGCSNWNAWHLAKSLIRVHTDHSVQMDSIQPPYNLVQREIETDVLPLCLDQRVGVIAYSPLGAGFLTGKYRPGGEMPKGTRFDLIPGHQPIYFTDAGWRIVDGLRSKSEELGYSMVQLALSWVLRRPGVTSVLVGARRLEHVDQAFDAERLDVPSEVYEALNAL